MNFDWIDLGKPGREKKKPMGRDVWIRFQTAGGSLRPGGFIEHIYSGRHKQAPLTGMTNTPTKQKP